jgi:phenylpropionate dioxygenase-like ring-hydroxylating dioxygenase large terminal subunit
MTATAPSTTARPAAADAPPPRSFPMEQWWVAALGDEVGRTMIQRWICGAPVVLYRTGAGDPVALDDRCVHRSFPLHKSRLEGDEIVCGYHGYTYGTDGRCTRLPATDRVPPRARVRSYPVVERGPFVWVWTGPVEDADPALVPETPGLEGEGWTHVHGYYNIRAPWLDLHENLLDLTHFTYLHAGNVGTPEWAAVPLESSVEGDVLKVSRVLRASPPPAIYAKPMGVEGHLVDRWSVSEIPTPAVHVAHARIVDNEPVGDRTDYNLKIIHAITPEGEVGLHQFWAIARDFSIDDQSVTDHLNTGTIKAFTEDVEALEAIQELIERDERTDHFQFSSPSDKPGLTLRKLVAGLVARETTV